MVHLIACTLAHLLLYQPSWHTSNMTFSVGRWKRVDLFLPLQKYFLRSGQQKPQLIGWFPVTNLYNTAHLHRLWCEWLLLKTDSGYNRSLMLVLLLYSSVIVVYRRRGISIRQGSQNCMLALPKGITSNNVNWNLTPTYQFRSPHSYHLSCLLYLHFGKISK